MSIDLKRVRPIVDPSPLRTADRDLTALMRLVAARGVSDLPVTSAYLDLRPADPGPNPVVRSGRVRLRERLRDAMYEIQREKSVHSPEYESLAGDNERLTSELDGIDPSVRGVVAFSCSGEGLFEIARLGVPVTDDVEIRPLAHLLQLAGIVDRARGLVALTDTHTLHLFRVRNGGLYELGDEGIDDDPDNYIVTKHAEQPQFDDHIKEHRKGFAKEAARHVARELENGRDDLLLLAGPEEATSLLLDELPKAAREKVVGQVHLELRSTYEELVEAVVPPLEEAHRARVADRADTAIGEARAYDLGARGPAEVGRHLERGAVQELFVDAALEREHQLDGGPPVDWVDDLIRQAAATDADTRFVTDRADLIGVGRVAALLRFRI
jgi:release factor family 10